MTWLPVFSLNWVGLWLASSLSLYSCEHISGRRTEGASSNSGDVDAFRTVKFDDWLRLFMQYAFVLAKQGEFDTAFEILKHASYSNPFQKPHIQDTIRLSIISKLPFLFTL